MDLARQPLRTLQTAELLAQLAQPECRKDPRLLQQIRAELAARHIRYREQQIAGSVPRRYLVEQTGSTAPVTVQSPLSGDGDPDTYGSPWWVGLLFLLVMLAVLVLLRLLEGIFQPVSFCYGVCIAAFLLLMEGWLLHSRQHHHYLARWLTEQYPPVSVTKQRLMLYFFAVLFGFSLTGTLSWLGHRVSAVPLQQPVLLVDMRRDYGSGCKFRLRLQFVGNNYRYLCLRDEQHYEALRPNDRLVFQGDWSLFGVTGHVIPAPPAG